MASLTQTSIIARRIIRYSIYTIVVFVILRFSYQVAVGIYKRIVPPPPEPPNPIFNKLPKISFPEKETPKNLTYTLELAEGKLPTLATKAEVFSMPQIQTSIGVVDEAKNKASLLGFNPQGKVLVETIPNVYVFQKTNSPSNLTMNIITKVFSISYNLAEDPSVLTGIPPDPQSAISQVREYLNSAQLLPEDLKDGPAVYEFLRTEEGKFIPAESLSESQIIKVNLFRKGLGGKNLPSVTPKMPQANVWFMISGKGQIIAAEYHYFPINLKDVGIYPLKTAEAAFEELKAGKGYIANEGNNPQGNIVIRKVYLAYYDAAQYSEYYQPVIVFEGDNSFFAFVPAVTDEYYGRE